MNFLPNYDAWKLASPYDMTAAEEAEFLAHEDDHIVQDASIAKMRAALALCSATIAALEFPLGCPVEGYDVEDIVNMIAVEFMPADPNAVVRGR